MIIFQSTFSIYLGLLSIIFEASTTIPQILKNHKKKSTDSLSEPMLWMWFVGDIFSVLGSISQGILPTAILLSVYCAFSDVVIIYQYYNYRARLDKTQHKDINGQLRNVKGKFVSYGTLECNGSASDMLNLLDENERSTTKIKEKRLSKKALSIFILITIIFIGATYVGCMFSKLGKKSEELEILFWPQLFGYMSAILHVGSHIPQIMQIHRDKSCSGLSKTMFFFSLIGNTLYILSFLSASTNKKMIIIYLPWILGSVLILPFDIIILYQLGLYG